jgi:toxin-antitoxin system PIN domain toxin
LRYLADVNVLLAAAWEAHPQHRPALIWLVRHAWAYCALTEIGFLRISLQPVFQRQLALDAGVLSSVFSGMVEATQSEFWPDIEPFHRSDMLQPELETADVTDAYLCALARQHGGKVATFDQALCRRFPEHALLIPAR